jgi:hypothetical protein
VEHGPRGPACSVGKNVATLEGATGDSGAEGGPGFLDPDQQCHPGSR